MAFAPPQRTITPASTRSPSAVCGSTSPAACRARPGGPPGGCAGRSAAPFARADLLGAAAGDWRCCGRGGGRAWTTPARPRPWPTIGATASRSISTRQTLALLHDLRFRDLVAEGSRLSSSTEQQLARISPAWPRPPRPSPRRSSSSAATWSTTRRCAAPAREPERFPAGKADAAAARIQAALDQLGAGPGDLGICGGACGGDLLFAKACLERGMRSSSPLPTAPPSCAIRSPSPIPTVAGSAPSPTSPPRRRRSW